MGQLLIRNLDDAVLDPLRQRAASTGTSMEEEARRALSATVGLTKVEVLARLDDIRARIGAVAGASSLEDLRADRDRRLMAVRNGCEAAMAG